jgi:ribA/ribD-fused uncharacterized protein
MPVIDDFRGPHAYLSNFFPAVVTFADRDYPTVEHAYQAAKSKKKRDREKMLSMQTPYDAKHLGRSFELRPDWERIKEKIMLMLLRQKFDQQPFKRWLIETDDAELIEGNYWNDTYWGVCNGEGQNRLGMLLMQVRDELQDA